MQPLFNNFFAWNLKKDPQILNLPRLTEEEHDELFALYSDAGIPETAMGNMEVVDGYLTACICGPELPPVHEWLEAIFGQPNLPICADSQMQERLLTLIIRRYVDITEYLRIKRSEITPDNLFLPLLCEKEDPADCIRPYQLDAQGNRLGDWELKDWAAGFQFAIATDPQWEDIFHDGDNAHYLGPIMIAQMGYNPDKLDYQYDDDSDIQPLLAVLPYHLRDYWHDRNRRNVMQVPYLRDIAKIGRNDACFCGSGKKYKKCCGG